MAYNEFLADRIRLTLKDRSVPFIMDFTKKPMKGFVFVDAHGYDMDTDLEFNPKATSSRKKK